MEHDLEDVAVTEQIELILPAQPEFLFLARLHVGGVASRMAMTIAEIEDLQLAVEELCLTLLGPNGPYEGRLRFDVRWDSELIEVRCQLTEAPALDASGAGDLSAGLPHSLSERILDALVDEHGASVENGARVAWLRKRREHSRPGQ